MWQAIETLIPSIGLLALFYYVMKHILEGDRRERIAQAQYEQENDLAKGAASPKGDEAVLQNAHLPHTAPGTMDTRTETEGS